MGEISFCFVEGALSPSSEIYSGDTDISSPNQNSTDEEKLSHRMTLVSSGTQSQQSTFSLDNKCILNIFTYIL